LAARLPPEATGFVVDGVDEMVEAVRCADEIDPVRCARVARQRFSPEVMTTSYLRFYRRVLVSGSSAAVQGHDSEMVAAVG
jgi:glycosyltransferase involved in cell wall biosynthesis